MIRRTLGALLLAAILPCAAYATGTFATFGPHLGFSTDPDQVVFGGQLQMVDVAPDLDFVPGVDVGFGDHATLVSLNGDFHYRFKIQGATWQPYAGGGLAVHFYSWDSGFGPHGSDTVGGGSLLFGADVPTKTGSRFFVEGKLALGDGPSFKAIAGWHFRMH